MPLPALQAAPDARSLSERTNRLIREFNREDTRVPIFALDTGSATAYAIAPVPGIEQYVVGQIFVFKAANANSGTAPTLAVNGLDAGTITYPNGGALAAGDIPANSFVEVVVASTTPTFHLQTRSVLPTIPIANAGATTFLTTSAVTISSGTAVCNTGSIGASGWVVLVIAVLVGVKTDGQAFIAADIHDGSAVLASAEAVNPAANQSVCITCAVVATLSGATTFTLRGSSSSTNTIAARAGSGGGATTDKMTAITYVRLA